MRRAIVAVLVLIIASAANASNAIFHLSGWAEIPSTYRHPGPVSGQFANPANGVSPPYNGQPIPGFSGMIPSTVPGTFIALPDNGYGAQGNSADFVLGFYHVTPVFKTTGDGTTVPGPVAVNSFTPFSDPYGYLDATYITGGPLSLDFRDHTLSPNSEMRPTFDSGTRLPVVPHGVPAPPGRQRHHQ